MEYSERIAIRDFVLDYLIEDGGVIEAKADRIQEELEADLEADSAWWDPEAPFAMIDAFTGAPIPPGAPDTRLLSLLFCIFDVAGRLFKGVPRISQLQPCHVHYWWNPRNSLKLGFGHPCATIRIIHE